MQEDQTIDTRWPLPSVDMAYVTSTTIQGKQVWELKGWDGVPLNSSTNRSSVFFHAAANGLTILPRH